MTTPTSGPAPTEAELRAERDLARDQAASLRSILVVMLGVATFILLTATVRTDLAEEKMKQVQREARHAVECNELRRAYVERFDVGVDEVHFVCQGWHVAMRRRGQP